jgi:hypothetical protein
MLLLEKNLPEMTLGVKNHVNSPLPRLLDRCEAYRLKVILLPSRGPDTDYAFTERKHEFLKNF